jgi:hypothetical protein
MGFLSNFLGKRNEPEPEKTRYFDTEIWNTVKREYGLSVEPYPSCPISGHRDVMWVKSGVLYFAPKKMTDIQQIEKYPLDIIKNYHVNPYDHNEIRINLVSPNQPQGKGEALKFRSNSLRYFRELMPDKEHKFSEKTMKLGKQTVINQQVKLGDLKDVRSGGEFEEYLTNLFSLLGYKTENTKITGDQGIDVLVSRGKERYGIQAKFYSQPVGNSAVQEVIAGREYFKLSKGIVVTNSTFTTSAKQLAEKTNVRLINGEELSKLIQMVKSGKTSGFVL